jgi:hypothetical protein
METTIASTTLGLAKDFGMVMGPCVGYIIQIYNMVFSKTAEGFSPYVSLILLLANSLRLFWLYLDPFSNVVLMAAILMIIC